MQARQKPSFSVIVPLEFHRGKAEECVRGWCRAQTYPRELFEVLLLAPEGFPVAELDALRPLLTSRDRLLLLPGCHDMALCVEGAKVASGDVLFFTEAHCWPDPDVLARSAEALAAHPEWAGFSCRSIPVTKNRLSVVEAEMYEADIEYGMTKHPWRKILDQCFVVRRGPYFEAGGFDATFGHFAEWLLAARFYQRRFAIGYWPAARIHHHYVGRVRIWKEFLEDFVSGQFDFVSRCGSDPVACLFDPVYEWEERSRWHAPSARRRVKELLGEMARSRAERSRGRAALATRLLRYLPAAASGTEIERLAFVLRACLIRLLLVPATRLTSGTRLRRVMMAYCGALTRARRLKLLAELRREERESEDEPRRRAVSV